MLSSIKKLIRAYWKPYLLIFAIYTIGLITMMRDHFLVLDDLSRSVYGYNWGQDWNRVTSSIVGYFLHQSITIFDISPINQLIAIAILSLSSLLLAKLFTKKLTLPALFFSTFLGLAPFMVNAWQFHFDSPFFALAILVSILPYTLYWGKLNLSFLKSPSKSTTKFLHLDLGLTKFLRAVLVTTICLSIMWTSFQSANGIFLVLGLGLMLKNFLSEQKQPYTTIITFILCYIASAFIAFLIAKDLTGYRDISTFPLADLIPGILKNLSNTINAIFDSLSATWAILLPISILCLITYACLTQKSLRPISALFYLIFSIPFAMSAYLLLIVFPTPGRTFVGICFAFTVFCLLCITAKPSDKSHQKSFDKKSLLFAPVFILLYSFCTFSWSYGNALAEQTDYDNFRITLVMHDLANIYKTNTEKDQVTLEIINSSGLSATMVQEFRAFPATRYTYHVTQTGINQFSNTGYIKPMFFYANSFHYPYSTNRAKEQPTRIELYDCDTPGYTTLVDNYYHEIRELPIKDEEEDRTVICLIFHDQAKNPQEDTLEKGPFLFHEIDNSNPSDSL